MRGTRAHEGAGPATGPCYTRQVTARPLLSFVAVVLLLTSVAPDAEARRRRKRGTATLTVTSTVDGADVIIDGKKAGTTPLNNFSITPGIHQLRVKKLGFMEYKKTISPKRGRTLTVQANLLPFAGVLAVTSNVSGAEVFVDEERIGTAPLEEEVKLGVHTVKVTAPGHVPYTRKISAAPGRRYQLDAQLKKEKTSGAGDDLALAPLVPLEAPPESTGADDLALEMPPLEDPTALSLESLPPASDGGELALEAPPLPPTEPPALAALPPSAITRTVEPPTPWYLQWYTLTGAAVVVAAAVIIPTVVVTTQGSGCEMTSATTWEPSADGGLRATTSLCRP